MNLISSAKQPKALYLLVCVQMWECFSFYGMRALLVFYLIKQFHFSEAKAFVIYALYTCLVEFGGMFGGALADLFLGQKRAIFIGGWLIALGHIILALEQAVNCLFLGLACIILGSSLFSSNISALLGRFYVAGQDQKREEGFTFFYMGINIGALLASALCGYVGETYGWDYGFSLAALGMIVGNAIFYFFRHVLEGQGAPPRKISFSNYAILGFCGCAVALFLMVAFSNENMLLSILPWMSLLFLVVLFRKVLQSGSIATSKIAMFILFLFALMIFFAAEEQIGSSLLVFSETYVDRSFLGFEIPASALLALNPMAIILLGPCVNACCKKLQGQSAVNTTSTRIMIAFLIGSLAYILFAIGCGRLKSMDEVPLVIFIGGVILISFAELFIGPAVYSYAAEISNGPFQGTIMSLVPIGFSLSSILGGHLSKYMSKEEGLSSLYSYESGFFFIALLLCAMGIFLGLISILTSRRRSMA